MKIGIGQINTTVGDFSGNAKKVLNGYRKLCEEGAELVLFSELVVAGYSPRDLVKKRHFIEGNLRTLEGIASEIGEVPAVIGFVDRGEGKRLYNAAAWCENGEVKGVGHKCLLPSYGVFEEERYFIEGDKPKVMNFKGKRIGITICEDIWTGEYLESHRMDLLDPVEYLKEQKVDLVVNLSASPWNYHKYIIREE